MGGRAARIAAVAAAVAVALATGACGESEPDPPRGPLAEGLSEVRGGAEHGALGVGWAEPGLVEGSGAGAELIAKAVGPNAGTVVEAAAELRRRFDLDPLAAERLVSVGGSYAFGLRLEGVDGRKLARALRRAGGEARRSDRVEIIDIGDYAVVPEPLLDAGVHGLGAFDAFGEDVAVLAISERARAGLLGTADRPRLLDHAIYRAAVDCLGDVVAARMIPDIHLLSVHLGIDLIAVGVGRDRELICALGGTAERADEVTSNLEAALAADAREPRTGESMAQIVESFDVASAPYEGVQVVRAELTLADAQPPGFVFDTISRGSVAEMIIGEQAQFRPTG